MVKRRAVYLSRVDKERMARGEISSAEEALHIYDAHSVLCGQKNTVQKKLDTTKKKSVELSAREREILAEVPPHFGKL